jgi:multidrug resistance efflux pump
LKSINFKRRGTEIRTLPEESRTARRKWDRITYILILIILLALGIYYASSKIFYTRAQGQVLYENVDIRLLDDCRVTRYFVHEYDSVRVGDTLFEYINDNDDTDNGGGAGGGGSVSVSVNAGGGKDNSWIEREILSKREKIATIEAKRKENLSLIKSYEAELERIRASVVLGVLPQSRLDLRQNEIVQLKAENSRLSEEIAELKKILRQLKADLAAESKKSNNVKSNIKIKGGANSGGQDSDNDNGGLAELEKRRQYFISPIDGTINQIFTKEFETALRDEVVLSVHKKSPIFVRVYFNQEDLDQIAVGEEFDIRFPDGTISKGVLKSFYYSTIPLPEEFQKRYEPVSRAVVGDVYPLNIDEAKRWKDFYKMSVDVSKYKY